MTLPHSARATAVRSEDGLHLIGLIATGQLTSSYQPIMCLDRLAPVGVEALLRGPAGTRWESPGALFGTARADGLIGELDWASRKAALVGVLAGGLQGPATLFINAEPEGLASQAFPGFDEVADAVAGLGIQVVLEVTERALTQDPAALLRTIGQVRELGWHIALDDVGAERASLALMPFLSPDVIKLDLRLIQARTTVDIAETVNAVLAHAERTGAKVLAEGIETERQLALARSMGAELGQGWLFGRPGRLDPQQAYLPLDLVTTEPPPAPVTPWDLASELPQVRTAAKPLLVAMSKTLERQAETAGGAAVVVGAFQRGEFFTVRTARYYSHLAETASLVVALGEDMPAAPAPGVRGSSLAADDPLLNEWDVAVVGPHFAAALIAVERQDGHPAAERRFDYVLTYDRNRAVAVARSLLDRVATG